MVFLPSGVSYTNSVPSLLLVRLTSFQLSRGYVGSALASASGSFFRPPRKEPTVWPFTSGRRSSRGFLFALASFPALTAPANSEPPRPSSRCTLPTAAGADSLAGSPAYTPEQKGSMSLPKASSPRLRLTNSLTLSSLSGGGGLIPIAPSPARILPGNVRKSPNTASAGEAGSALRAPSQSTNRYEPGSARRMSSCRPTSQATSRIGSPGWNELGPSSQVYGPSVRVVMLPPTTSRASVTTTLVFDPNFFATVKAMVRPVAPAPTTTTSTFSTSDPSALVFFDPTSETVARTCSDLRIAFGARAPTLRGVEWGDSDVLAVNRTPGRRGVTRVGRALLVLSVKHGVRKVETA
mmetsp:Transcript_28419/g.62222  ORF Transcript_28419/g.62222 Transcript_28419/m.62222 type:complete len:351 (-) Transcript_28419:50-1102(-)